MSPRTTGRWALWAPLIVFAGFVGLVLIGLLRPASSDVPSRMVGQPVPQFVLPPAVSGMPGLTSGDLAGGRPRLLNVFASWCVPCIAEAPVLLDIQRHGVEIDGIALRDHPEDLAAFLKTNGNPYTRIGADNVGAVQLDIGSSGVPETFLIDRHDIIRAQHIGPIRPEEEAMILAQLRAGGA